MITHLNINPAHCGATLLTCVDANTTPKSIRWASAAKTNLLQHRYGSAVAACHKVSSIRQSGYSVSRNISNAFHFHPIRMQSFRFSLTLVWIEIGIEIPRLHFIFNLTINCSTVLFTYLPSFYHSYYFSKCHCWEIVKIAVGVTGKKIVSPNKKNAIKQCIFKCFLEVQNTEKYYKFSRNDCLNWFTHTKTMYDFFTIDSLNKTLTLSTLTAAAAIDGTNKLLWFDAVGHMTESCTSNYSEDSSLLEDPA